MADVTNQSPSLSEHVGGPTSAIGGNTKVSGFDRPSGNMTPDADTRVAPNITPSGR